MQTVKIYHNPACGTSRNTLRMIRASGVEPEVIEYLKTPPNRETLCALLAATNISPRQLLRGRVRPILINRPIVVTSKGTRLCRPSELVLEILENPNIGTFTKEDGEVIQT